MADPAVTLDGVWQMWRIGRLFEGLNFIMSGGLSRKRGCGCGCGCVYTDDRFTHQGDTPELAVNEKTLDLSFNKLPFDITLISCQGTSEPPQEITSLNCTLCIFLCKHDLMRTGDQQMPIPIQPMLAYGGDLTTVVSGCFAFRTWC